jgi:hypothetical protein
MILAGQLRVEPHRDLGSAEDSMELNFGIVPGVGAGTRMNHTRDRSTKKPQNSGKIKSGESHLKMARSCCHFTSASG